MTIARDPVRAAWRDAGAVLVLVVVMVAVGSGGFARLDPALLGYLLATLASVALTAQRVALFWRRPQTAPLGRALLAGLRRREGWVRGARGASVDLVAQRFLVRRGAASGAAHLLLAWGTMVAFAITVPLVFGWLDFAAAGERTYRARLLGVVGLGFDVDGVLAWFVFHALILCSLAVVVGVAMLLAARLRRRSVAGAGGSFHLGPLILLGVVALSGLALPAVAASGSPAAIALARRVHEISVVALLLALPAGKLFHVFLRPLQLAAAELKAAPAQACRACGAALSSAQIEIVERLLRERGVGVPERVALCPACRRRGLARSHAGLLAGGLEPPLPRPNPLRRAA